MKIQYIIIGILLFLTSCKNGLQRVDYSGSALGTSYNIIAIDNNGIDLQKKIDSVFVVVNKSMSTYMPESDISRINRGDSTVVVDHMFRSVFELSKEIFEDTKGYFDPTVGTLVNAWGFGPKSAVRLDSVKVDSLLKYVGFDKVALNSDNFILKSFSEVYIDFNAIAKGYAIDRLAVVFDEHNVKNYLIEVGGEIIAKGNNALKEKPWLVGIDDPQVASGRSSKIFLELKDMALASSGNYRKFRIDEISGKKYVHTINPKSGFTKNSNTLAVTIISDNCAKADAYATAFMAMELDQAFKLILRHTDLEAYIIYIDDHGDTQEFFTKGFKKLVRN